MKKNKRNITVSENNDNLPDPLENLQKLFAVILSVLYQVFTKVVPILGVSFLAILLILYLFFKLFGLV